MGCFLLMSLLTIGHREKQCFSRRQGSDAWWRMQARPEDADKKFEERKHWDDTVKAKEEDLARIGLDDKKVCPPSIAISKLPRLVDMNPSSTGVWPGRGCTKASSSVDEGPKAISCASWEVATHCRSLCHAGVHD